ncbi:MAG: DNA polymerase/3'-5' exonuclease PolX [Thermoanaerobaculia bacterium]|nr:DNA polymerase/3'-5' exonuclease PolX [Thermoanaerobaculia bacterium]
MSANAQVAEVFDQMAAALELLGANRFRVNAHEKVARVLRDLTDDVRAVVEENPPAAVARLRSFDGIGESSAKKICEWVETGSVPEHQKLLSQVPLGLFEVLAIPGVGPKAAKLMWEELGIESLEDLKTTSDEALSSLPRMGKKSVEKIRQAIDFSEKSGDRVPLGVARPMAQKLVAELSKLDGMQQVDFAGSLRRGKETIGDIDILVATTDAEAVREAFCSHPDVTQVLARGETKCSVRLENERGVVMQADLRIVPEEAWGAALMYFTGSKEHNVRLREIAIGKDRHLNEYGLFSGTAERPQDRGETPVAAASEESIYQALELPFVPPEMREDRDEFSDRWNGEALISLSDVKAELHAHTTASDGRLSIEELAKEARRRGFHTLAVTDHSKSQPIANGLDEDRLLAHIDAIRKADAKIDGIRILAGSEVDILADGSLDYDDELLAQLDIVVASPHAALRQEPVVATERLLRAIRHPLVHIIGHPTGRIVGRREGLSPDTKRLYEAAVEHDTVLELNSNWNRLDLRDAHLRAALQAGCKIAIDTDAHDTWQLDHLVYGILTARRAGMRPEQCINTWPADKLHSWLESKR